MKKFLKAVIKEGYENPLFELRAGQFLHARFRDWLFLFCILAFFPAVLIFSSLEYASLYYLVLLIEIALLVLVAYVLKEITRRAIYVTIFLVLVALTCIHSFAAIYSVFGLCIGECMGTNPTVIYESYSSTYFSIVSWTTLGYGDYQPVGWMRAVAAIEALFGYIFMGIIVGFSAQITYEMFKKSHETKTLVDDLSEERGYSGEPEH